MNSISSFLSSFHFVVSGRLLIRGGIPTALNISLLTVLIVGSGTSIEVIGVVFAAIFTIYFVNIASSIV